MDTTGRKPIDKLLLDPRTRQAGKGNHFYENTKLNIEL